MGRARWWDRQGLTAWRLRRYDYAMRCWAIYLKQVDDERRAWYGIY